MRWHRRLVAGAWIYPHYQTGRPTLDKDVVQLIIRLARENLAGATSGSRANSSTSASRCQRPRSGQRCDVMGSIRPREGRPRRGGRSSAGRLRGSLRVTFVCHEREGGLRCSEDRSGAVLHERWGLAPRSRPAGGGCKPPQAAPVKSRGGERCGKGAPGARQVRVAKASGSEPLMTCRNSLDDIETGVERLLSGRAWREPADWPGGVRHEGGASAAQALVWNMGTCRLDTPAGRSGRQPGEGDPQAADLQGAEYRRGAQGRTAS